MTNFILRTDSYKLNHWNQYPADTEAVYSYFESRAGATFPYTVFFGLQSILKTMAGPVVSHWDVNEAYRLATKHFGSAEMFNVNGWDRIVEEHGGCLPLRIKAVAEGSVVPTGHVLMTVENTDPECYWLTNAVESLLTHVWYPSTVATLSRTTFEMMARFLDKTAEDRSALPFMLHDFGYRGATSDESAAIGGAAHLANGLGTDTLLAMEFAMEEYRADLDTLAFSVPATEHSVMTSLGREGEFAIVDRLLDKYPTGILSVVADSYDIYGFVRAMGDEGLPFRERILARDGKFVIRPDSVTPAHDTPHGLVANLIGRLWDSFGGTVNAKGYKVLNPKVGLLWGDGINPAGIESILDRLELCGFSAENMVFGMGGGLLQKVNRDTQRFAFKSSAQKRDGVWHDVYKEPLDASKCSKRGRLKLAARHPHGWTTMREEHAIPLLAGNRDDLLQTVFEDGVVVNPTTFDEVRERAALR